MITLEKTLPVLLFAGMLLMVANVVWGYRDARSRGRSGILVALLVMWTFPFGVVLWLIFRPEVVDETSEHNDPDHDLKKRANAGIL